MELIITTPLVSTPQRTKIHHVTNIPERNDATHIICIILNTYIKILRLKTLTSMPCESIPKKEKQVEDIKVSSDAKDRQHATQSNNN